MNRNSLLSRDLEIQPPNCADNINVDLVSLKPIRLIRLPEVMMRVGLRRSTIYRKMGEGRFPRPRSIGPKCAVWIEAEIDEWINCVVRNGRR